MSYLPSPRYYCEIFPVPAVITVVTVVLRSSALPCHPLLAIRLSYNQCIAQHFERSFVYGRLRNDHVTVHCYLCLISKMVVGNWKVSWSYAYSIVPWGDTGDTKRIPAFGRRRWWAEPVVRCVPICVPTFLLVIFTIKYLSTLRVSWKYMSKLRWQRKFSALLDWFLLSGIVLVASVHCSNHDSSLFSVAVAAAHL